MASAKENIREFFKSHIGCIIDTKELQKVAGVSDHGRRLRELIASNWPIQSHNDNSALSPGQYLCTAIPETEIQTHALSKRIRAEVLNRDGFTCQDCGKGAGEIDENGRKVRLHIGHFLAKSLGGDDDIMNLRTLCSHCNQGASNIIPEHPSKLRLFTQVRRATRADQIALYEMLKLKFNY